MGTAKRVLLIDDDIYLAELLRLHLRDEGYAVRHAIDARQGLALLQKARWDALVLDLIRPRYEGLKISQRARAMGLRIPIVITSAQASARDRVLGLELGADAYMAKPYSMRELTVRLQALLRHTDALAANAHPRCLEIEGLSMDPEARTASLDGAELGLLRVEFNLLYFLACRPNQVVSRSELTDEICGYKMEGSQHSIRAYISRLRAKIELDASTPRRIITVWGRGYKFAAPLDPQPDSPQA